MSTKLNMQQKAYLTVLAKLIKLLSRPSYLTVSDVAREMGCTYEGASRRIATLQRKRCKLKSEVVKCGISGAPPRCWRLIPNAQSNRILDLAKSFK